MDYMANTFVGRAEQRGRQEGRREERIRIICNLLDVLTDEQISERTKMSIEEVAKLREEKSKLEED